MSNVSANGRGRFTRRRAAVTADVARLAGVSHRTVSRVLNDPDRVREETRERVEAAMEMLDYRPNSVARALVTGQTRVLGVISFDTTQYGPASTLSAVERAAHEAGYHVSIASARRPDPRTTLDAVERFRVQGVDGILRLMHEAGRAVPDELSVVGFDDQPEASFFNPPLTTVRQDFLEMGRRGLELLLDEIERGGRTSRRETVAPELVVRASTAPLAR
jgi:DNA-binding LacI/PurR family transcriptional regulator